MFDRPAMLHFQALLDNTYKPPSLNVLERRLLLMTRSGFPVWCVSGNDIIAYRKQ